MGSLPNCKYMVYQESTACDPKFLKSQTSPMETVLFKAFPRLKGKLISNKL